MALPRALLATTTAVLLAFAGMVPVAAATDASSLRRPPGVTVARSDSTGLVRFIGTAPGQPIAHPDGAGVRAPMVDAARAFLDSFGPSFGIADQEAELQVTSSTITGDGRSVIRFQQVREGIPVLGGEIVVNLDSDQNLLSAGGEALPESSHMSTEAKVPASAARTTARLAVAKDYKVSSKRLVAATPSLWIYDSRILGGPGLGIPRLVWRTEVTNTGRQVIDEFVLVDARLGSVALAFSQVEEALNRSICDANNTSAQVPCTSPVRTEGGAPNAVQDVNDAYEYLGDTYDFYSSTLGRNSVDGSGMTLKATVRYCDPAYACPYANAYWNGSQMVFGQGFAAADDVVGHELTHGVTDYTSGLFYYYQSGAINESLSDVFGEFVDLTNGAGTDTVETRWQMGEDVPGFGAGRDMEDPTIFGDPDRMTSPNYTADVDELDGGGVHTNSGVNNKAAFLITDGATFNGRTVTGLGITKAAKIYYEVQTHLLTSASDYADLASALPQACTNLVGTAGITPADCTEVNDAVMAVEMNQSPPAAPNPEAPVCPAGQSPTNLFFDNLDAGLGNWGTQTLSGTNAWYGGDFYATSGTDHLYGDDQASTSDSAARMTSSVAIPAGSSAYLRFAHAFGFEDGNSAWDGGVLEYSTNGGTSWADAGSLATDNGYNGTISNSWGNPLGGRSAFVRESNGYISSRFNLASLGGQSVRFRFRIGTDSSGADYGWFVDDVRIYTCGGGATPTLSIDDVTQNEGNSGTTNFVFAVTLSAASASTVTVNYATANGTAVAPGDYASVSGGLTFSPNQTTKTITVPVVGDVSVEPNETFTVGLSGASGATISDPSGTGTITDDDDTSQQPSTTTMVLLGGYGTSGIYRLYHVGKKEKDTTTVSPDHTGVDVSVYVDKWNSNSGQWVSMSGSPWSFTLDTGSKVTTWWKPGKGKYRSYATFAGDSTHLGSQSAYVYYRFTR